MNDLLEDMFISLDRLYYLYEEYIWKNKNCRLVVLVKDNTICFYLYKDKEVIDEIILSFDERERSIYEYIGVRLLILLLGNVYIYNYENIFYNDRHKSYLRLIVLDKDIMKMMKMIIDVQDYCVVSENMEYVVNIKNCLVIDRDYNEVLSLLNERINFSRKLLKKV